MQTASLIFFALAWLIMAVICLLYSGRVQAYAIRSVERTWSAKYLVKYFRSSAYLINLRACGALALLGFAFLCWMIIRNWPLLS